MEKTINYILKRFKENTTWTGIFILLSHFGFKLSAEDTLVLSSVIITFMPNTIDLNGDGIIDDKI